MLAALVVSWAAALVASHVPMQKVPSLRVSDTKLHFIGFYLLTGLFWLTLSAYARRLPWRVALVLTVMPVYGAVDELTQPWFRRTAAWGDWLADMAGAAAALGCLELVVLMTRRPAE